MEQKKEDNKIDLQSEYQKICLEYDRLVKTNPNGMTAEQIRAHHEKCKESAAKKKAIAEKINKLPAGQRFVKEDKK